MPRTRRPPVDREPHDWWLGACEFITKPVDFDVLNAVARRRSVERTSVGHLAGPRAMINGPSSDGYYACRRSFSFPGNLLQSIYEIRWNKELGCLFF